MFKKICIAVIALSSVIASAEETFLGLYMQGGKIGWSSYSTHPEPLDGKTVLRSDTKTLMDMGLLGQSMKISIDSTTWSSNGKPLRMSFTMSSGGRKQILLARFDSSNAEIDVNNGGAKSHVSLPIPKDGLVTDDPMTLMVSDKVAPGTKRKIYILDPTTVSFIRNDVVFKGSAKTTVKGKSVSALQIDILDPRASTTVFVSSKGDIIKAEGPMGIEMIPEPRTVAMNGKGGYHPSADLAFATSIKPDKQIKDPANLKGLKLKISGRDLSALPSDAHQTVSKSGSKWIVDVHPPQLSAQKAQSISSAAAQKPSWTKPSLHIPSDSEEFKTLAAYIVGEEKDSLKAAQLIQKYVNDQMHPNAGIGVLRDASEVLKTKEGVCRDYAILTATLMRAAGIPAKLASGLVSWNGEFFYHAWVEIWDGQTWVGIDSTTEDKQLSAAHVKLAEGNVDTAFAFTFLERVKVEVLDVRR